MIWTQQAMGHQARLRKILKPTVLQQRCNKAITVIMQNISQQIDSQNQEALREGIEVLTAEANLLDTGVPELAVWILRSEAKRSVSCGWLPTCLLLRAGLP